MFLFGLVQTLLTPLGLFSRFAALALLVGALSASSLSFAQTSYPLSFAFEILAEVSGVSIVVNDAPVKEVQLPVELPNNTIPLIESLASVNGLNVCSVEGVYIVSSAVLCRDVRPNVVAVEYSVQPPVMASTAETVLEVLSDEPVNVPYEPKSLVYELTVLELNTNEFKRLGLDTSSLFAASNLLALGIPAIASGFMAPEVFDTIISAYESEGVASSLESVALYGREFEPVVFSRGGDINVYLVGGGESVNTSVSYGFDIEFVASLNHDQLDLEYSLLSSAPIGQTSQNIVQLAKTSSSSKVTVSCLEPVVLGSFTSEKRSFDGGGIPWASALPVLGFAAGQGSSADSQSTIVLTLSVSCG